MPDRNKKYQALVDKLIADAERALDRQAGKSIRLLNEARKEIIASIARSDWQAFYLPQQQAAVERALEDFARKFRAELTGAQSSFWERGIEMVDKPLHLVGVTAMIPAIDITALTLMQQYGANLVSGLGKDAAQKVINEITLGLMGHKSPYEVMKAVGTNLKDASVFKSIAARAETITRTEAGRVLEAASQARMKEAAQVVPGLKKQWQHGGSALPRPSHLAAHGQIRDVDEPFDVGNEKLMFPRDPAGSAGNTINCSCYTVPYKEEWQEEARKAA